MCLSASLHHRFSLALLQQAKQASRSISLGQKILRGPGPLKNPTTQPYPFPFYSPPVSLPGAQLAARPCTGLCLHSCRVSARTAARSRSTREVHVGWQGCCTGGYLRRSWCSGFSLLLAPMQDAELVAAATAQEDRVSARVAAHRVCACSCCLPLHVLASLPPDFL
jgi:hypothetical protein